MMRAMMARWNKVLLVLPLLVLLAGCRNPVGDGPRHRAATGVVITDLQDDQLVGFSAGGGWVGPLPVVQVGEEMPVRIYFLDANNERFQLPLTGAPHTLRINFDPPGIIEYQDRADGGVFRGLAPGATDATIMIWHGSHEDFVAPPLRLEVMP